ncbi:MAG: alpha-L-fucosidase [Alphaproteobacteria bacterium]|nr:alpha-L-fucosidase [Alphaproteobacteria bacterium]
MKISVAVVSLALVLTGANAQWAPMANDPGAAQRIAWWRDAKFGMFIHWSLATVTEKGDWVQWNEQIPVREYAKLADKFTGSKFNPDAWAATAKAAGMKYMVMVSRHHDGFALFNDPGNSFTSVATAAHRDFIGDFVKAARTAGMRVGLYYSPLDWRFPGYFFPDLYRTSAEEMRAQYHRQLHELASHYGPLDILWFDGGGNEWLGFGGVHFANGQWSARPKNEPYKGTFLWNDDQAVGDLRRLQPSIVINDRTDAPADFRDREGDAALGGFENRYPWELCTMLAPPWMYVNGAKPKTPDEVIRLLISVVGRDGNLLLNVGPKPDGEIPDDQVAVLKAVGRWLKHYGQSIYATRGGPYLPGPYGVSTYRGNTVYLHILDRTHSSWMLPPLPVKVEGCSAFAGRKPLCEQTADGLHIALPGTAHPVDRVVILQIDGTAADIQPIVVNDTRS